MKNLFILAAIALGCGSMKAQYAAQNFTLVGLINPETTMNAENLKYSGCWGWYQASKNKEYGIACSHRGTYWIDITNPATPTVCAYRAGAKSGCTWREAKSYQNYLYVISDDNGTNSFQIFDMQYLPDSVHKVYDGTQLFRQGHTLWVDGNNLYVASVTEANNNFSSMNVYSLATPTNPTLIRRLDQDYSFINHVHDMFVRRDTVFASCGNQGLYVFKFSPTGFSQIGSLITYPYAGYNHSSALTPDGKTLVFMDEVPAGLPIKVADVTNLANIQVLATTNQFPNTTPHNPFIADNNYCFVSSYQDGLQLYDISVPATPTLAGYFDTYPQGGGNNNTWPLNGTYRGQWGCYPFFPSGSIFALDRLNGAFVLNSHLYNGPMLTLTPSIPDSVCAGSSATASVEAMGAVTFSWSSSAIAISDPTAAVTSLSLSSPGAHTIAVTAANGNNSTTATYTVHAYLISATAGSSDASCESCSDGSAFVNVSGGKQPYFYQWTPSGGNGPAAMSLATGCYTVSVTDVRGCVTATQVCVGFVPTETTSVNAQRDETMIVYPNPASDEVFVSFSGRNFEWKMINVTGAVVAQGHSAGDTQIALSGLNSGIYYVIFRNGDAQRAQKLIISR